MTQNMTHDQMTEMISEKASELYGLLENCRQEFEEVAPRWSDTSKAVQVAIEQNDAKTVAKEMAAYQFWTERNREYSAKIETAIEAAKTLTSEAYSLTRTTWDQHIEEVKQERAETRSGF